MIERRASYLLGALDTIDSVGVVLRLQLATEVLLDEYVEMERTGVRAEFVSAGRFFGDKLSTSVAFGLPIPLARVCKHLNKMRNDVAHPTESGHGVGPDAVQEFVETVHRIKDMDPGFISPVDDLLMPRPEKNAHMRYRGANDAPDMVMAYFYFDMQFVKWVNERRKQLQLARDLISN